MSMATDQRRKRVNGVGIAGYGSREQHRTKRKNLGLVQNALCMRSHISVELDGNQKRVVAKREQIGISWRQMKPFVNYVSNANDHKILGDVFTVPQEIFDLDNLSEVLSYEVWKTHLLENERNLLMQFLPGGIEPHQVVEELLAGSNFHFGNPVIKWGDSLCSGDLHPDMIIYREHHLKFEKRAYYSQLHNYHNNMIGFLSELKERWQSCKDTEKEIVPKTWRQKHVERRIPLNVDESRVYDHEENVTMLSESCSSDAEEKAYSSDNQISSPTKDDKHQRRVLEKGILKGKSRSLMFSSYDLHNMGEKAKEGDKLPDRDIPFIDSDKYMSCIKISKQQHKLVKSMKQSDNSIQSKSLISVLGNLSNIHVQSYEVFVKEEQKKLHEHWLQLVNNDFPVAYANWKQIKLQRHSMINSLVEELKDKPNPSLEDKDSVNSGSELQDQDKKSMSSESEFKDQNDDNVSSGDELLDENKDNVSSGSGLHNQDEDNMSSENELENGVLNEQSNLKDHEISVARVPENHSSHNSYVSGDDDFSQPKEDSENNVVLSKSDGTSLNKYGYSKNIGTQDKDEYSRDMDTQDVSIDEGAPFASGSDVWRMTEMPHSYYDSARTHEYATSGLSLTNPQVAGDPRNHVIDLEAGLNQEVRGKELFHRHSDDMTFSCYQSQDRSALLNSLFEGGELDFQTSNNVMVEDGQCSSQFKDPIQMSLTLEQQQRRATEVYMPESMSQNIYSNAGSYLIPSQEPFIPGQDSSLAMPSQSQMNTANFAGHHWAPAADQQVYGGWSGSDGNGFSSQSVSTGVDNDQSLFSILSHYNQLCSNNSYNSIKNMEQFGGPRTYGLDAASMPRVNAAVPQVPRVHVSVPPASHPLDYLTGREAPSGMMPDDMTWMNVPHQNCALHDQMAKPYLKSWNR